MCLEKYSTGLNKRVHFHMLKNNVRSKEIRTLIFRLVHPRVSLGAVKVLAKHRSELSGVPPTLPPKTKHQVKFGGGYPPTKRHLKI